MSGLSRTPGKRVWVNSPPRVRIPPSPPASPCPARTFFFLAQSAAVRGLWRRAWFSVSSLALRCLASRPVFSVASFSATDSRCSIGALRPLLKAQRSPPMNSASPSPMGLLVLESRSDQDVNPSPASCAAPPNPPAAAISAAADPRSSWPGDHPLKCAAPDPVPRTPDTAAASSSSSTPLEPLPAPQHCSLHPSATDAPRDVRVVEAAPDTDPAARKNVLRRCLADIPG